MSTDRKFSSIRRPTRLSLLYWRIRRLATQIFHWVAPKPKSIKLFEKEGATSTITLLRWDKEFVEFYTIDIGEGPTQHFGRDEHEFWTRVEKPAFPELLQALGEGSVKVTARSLAGILSKRFNGDSGATEKFEKLCVEKNVPHRSDFWTSGD